MHELCKLSNLTSYGFLATDGEIGHLKEVYFDDLHWQVRYIVVKTDNWIAGRQVLLTPSTIQEIDDDNKLIHVSLSCEQIKKSPPIDSKQPVSKHYQQQFHSYYGLDPYWTADPLFLETPFVLPLKNEAPQEPENPHLRSSNEVTGYKLETTDNSVGQIKDLIVDNHILGVRYLEIDTRILLPGRHVLISPAWIEQVDWRTQQVKVELTEKLVKEAPEYDSGQPISRDYELELYRHYGKMLTN